MQKSETAERIRRITARLIDESPDSKNWNAYRSELEIATRELAAEQKAWSDPSETDTPQAGARQSYRSRETDSAEGFAQGLNLFRPGTRDSKGKKD